MNKEREVEEDFRVSVEDGKYTIISHKDGRLRALRNGEEWRSLVGDKMAYYLAYELNESQKMCEMLQKEIKELKKKQKES